MRPENFIFRLFDKTKIQRKINLSIILLCNILILWTYVHIRIFTFTCIYFLPCLFENQWNVDEDEPYMKIKPNLFGRKGEWCSHQRRIQNLIKYLVWKKHFAKIMNSWKSLTILQKALSLMFERVLNMPLVVIQIALLVQLFLNVICHLDSYYRPPALTHGIKAATKMFSLYTFLYTYRLIFIKDQKHQKSLKN